MGLDAGFVVVPVLLLRHQKDLGLDDGAMMTLLNVIASWWYEGKLPFPGTHTIAQRMGVSERTVQRHLTKLEKLGLLQRRAAADLRNETRRTSYDPAGLVLKIAKYGAAYKARATAAPAAQEVAA